MHGEADLPTHPQMQQHRGHGHFTEDEHGDEPDRDDVAPRQTHEGGQDVESVRDGVQQLANPTPCGTVRAILPSA